MGNRLFVKSHGRRRFLAGTGFADQQWIGVLSEEQCLHGRLDLNIATNYARQLSGARFFGQVNTEICQQRWPPARADSLRVDNCNRRRRSMDRVLWFSWRQEIQQSQVT